MTKFRLGNTKASRLTALDVREIREKWANGAWTQVRLSRDYQVSITTIRNIIYGVTWQRLPAVIPEEQISLEAKVSQEKFLAGAVEPIMPPDDMAAKLLRDAAQIDSPPGEQRVDPIDAYLKRSKEEGSK